VIHIIGSPTSNAKAVYYAYKDLGIECKIVVSPVELIDANRIVLPGVGAFGALSKFLRETNFTSLLHSLIDEGAKLLGICLGMQILGQSSEESAEERGLSKLEINCRKFQTLDLRVPHTGWDQVSISTNHEIFDGLSREFSAYFSHSYYLPVHRELTLAITDYGDGFTSVIGKDNIVGVQFHPERSQSNGRKILSNFADW
jgi:imidazole glycerol-phosphate synthase subunit HisH